MCVFLQAVFQNINCCHTTMFTTCTFDAIHMFLYSLYTVQFLHLWYFTSVYGLFADKTCFDVTACVPVSACDYGKVTCTDVC